MGNECTLMIGCICEGKYYHAELAALQHTTFFAGLGLGTITGGTLGFLFHPRTVSFSFLSSYILGSLLASRFQVESGSWFVWLGLAFCTMGDFAVTYIYTLEILPESWRLWTALVGFGFMWTLGKALVLNCIKG